MLRSPREPLTKGQGSGHHVAPWKGQGKCHHVEHPWCPGTYTLYYWIAKANKLYANINIYILMLVYIFDHYLILKTTSVFNKISLVQVVNSFQFNIQRWKIRLTCLCNLLLISCLKSINTTGNISNNTVVCNLHYCHLSRLWTSSLLCDKLRTIYDTV